MAIANYDCPACPTDCSTVSLPSVDFPSCTEAIYEELSEICGIYMINESSVTPGDPAVVPADWTSLPAWETVLAQTGADKIRYLVGIGDLPEPEQTIRELSKKRKKLGNKTFQLLFDVDDINDTNREFIRQLECGATVFIWFETLGGALYGGPNGIKADVIRANLPLDRGPDSYARGVLQFEWESTCHPVRVDNPMA